MPIYAYRCEACGHAKDVLQKLADPVLTVCPACGAETFRKQLTAAGFQLKGSGWYVTDFRDGNSGGKPKADDAAAKPADGDSAAAAKPADAGAPKETASTAPAASPSAPSGSPAVSTPTAPSTALAAPKSGGTPAGA